MWLAATEKRFGGYHRNVPRGHVSEFDPRTPDQIATGGMTGGDRMFHHGYAEAYADGLAPFVAERNKEWTILEVGILKGTGLALWSELFPNADVIGLDIDLDHTRSNLPMLKQRGAFPRTDPELHRFDQFADGESRIAEILNGRNVDICIDDGFHSTETILKTAEAIAPFLSERFVYFAEDNDHVAPSLEARFPKWDVRPIQELTVISPR